MNTIASRLPHTLDNGLLLRRATPADIEAVADFDARVHSDQGWDKPDEPLRAWVKDLMSGNHPTVGADNFLVVEDTATGAVVSSTCLIPQTWSYGGIPFGVGRIELVGTHPDYRRRGLVRVQFDVLHAWCASKTLAGRELSVQAITGIPWYYRQFGYEMAPELYGARRGPLSYVPELNDDQSEPFAIRPATPDDLAFIAEVTEAAQQRSLLNCVRDAALWRYELDGRLPQEANRRRLCVIATPEGDRVGFLAHPDLRWGSAIALTVYELKPGVSWWAVTPSVLRYLKRVGVDLKPYYPDAEGGPPCDAISFALEGAHPAYDIAQQQLPQVNNPYAWFIRVADLPGFLRQITPVLEQRLAQSTLAGHSGTLKLDFYQGGVKLDLERGHIVDVAGWAPGKEDDLAWPSEYASVGFPALTFLLVLFGYRTLADLKHIYADCRGNLEGRLLVHALFPQQASAIWPVA
jgi:hypothetical protein